MAEEEVIEFIDPPFEEQCYKQHESKKPSNAIVDLDTLWKEKLGENHENIESFYEKGINYWQNIDATNDGMLGGFSHVSPLDVKASAAFLKDLKINFGSVLDCGAGIGRVSKGLLIPLFKIVDMVEQNKAYVERAKAVIKNQKMRNFFCCGLQEFTPIENEYDCIWIQWVIGHLPDDHFIAFLKRCQKGLKKGGVVCLKENVCKNSFDFDEEDGSVTRSEAIFLKIFESAGLKVPKSTFPSEDVCIEVMEVLQNVKLVHAKGLIVFCCKKHLSPFLGVFRNNLKIWSFSSSFHLFEKEMFTYKI